MKPNSMTNVIIAFSLVFSPSLLMAAEPTVPTEPPYIVLSDNLDEPNGYGFCIDTYGRGHSELLQTHTCKPRPDEGSPRNHSGHDVRFEYNSKTNRIQSYAFEGLCMQGLLAKGKSELALLDCSDAKHQGFVYQEDDQTIRLQADNSYCLAVTSETQTAGPWVKRPLQLAQCDEITPNLMQWTVVPL
ncbi:hypothetical protein MACH09_32600 [Vibrio sp. MACH09]|uniref:ricin-type beta-trefoil lectin domain protein n=1 Tax=Vibrio sp. MACH09 TaxID=3025122 RepID=UPI00278DD132|nr:ricin-type beta-trefoil lectin domain protein [Vibrio sp. MACH09]GLO62752.1 hypothetical protein MACH09_32600 [Vibrio sp. MACH09]